jgi:hypothetical protein
MDMVLCQVRTLGHDPRTLECLFHTNFSYMACDMSMNSSLNEQSNGHGPMSGKDTRLRL